jgi:RNA polymerase sigma-70 factor (ECF subfamily)
MPAYGESHMNERDFKCLFDIYKNRVFGYVLAVSHSPYIAEEITQEIFIKLWLCRDMLNKLDNPEAYILTIARNKTLNFLRRAALESKILREMQARMIPSYNNVEEMVFVSDQNKLLQEALILLPPRQRLVYRLSRDQGLNHRQIAGRLQVSPNTVKNHLVFAIKFIRKYLAVLNAVTVLLMGLAQV